MLAGGVAKEIEAVLLELSGVGFTETATDLRDEEPEREGKREIEMVGLTTVLVRAEEQGIIPLGALTDCKKDKEAFRAEFESVGTVGRDVNREIAGSEPVVMED